MKSTLIKNIQISKDESDDIFATKIQAELAMPWSYQGQEYCKFLLGHIQNKSRREELEKLINRRQ